MGGLDTSWQDYAGNKITLEELLVLVEDVAAEEFPVTSLRSHLITWYLESPSEVKKIHAADLRYPILVLVDGNKKIISIIDGHHRTHKAALLGLKKINTRLIPVGILPDTVQDLFLRINNNVGT